MNADISAFVSEAALPARNLNERAHTTLTFDYTKSNKILPSVDASHQVKCLKFLDQPQRSVEEPQTQIL